MLNVVRRSQMVNLMAIDRTTATRFNTVEEVWVDDTGRAAYLAGTQGYTPLEQVEVIEPDAVLTYSRAMVEPPANLRRLYRLAVRSPNTDSSGWVEDFLFDWETKEIAAYILGGDIATPFGERIEGLTFTPNHLWLPYDQKLPIFQAPYQKGDWVMREVEGEELVWGTLPFAPQVERRQKARSVALEAARKLHQDYQVGGVGVIGDLVHPESPWNFWSEISLVVWDVPKNVNLWELGRDLGGEFEIDWVQPSWCTPAQWQQITTEMDVLAGDWVESCHAPVRKRYKLFEVSN